VPLLALRIVALAVHWVVLITSGLAMVLPNAGSEVCDPAQCVRQAQEAQTAQRASPLTAGDEGESLPEHDCGGPFHVCHCCAHAQVVSQRLSFRIGEPRFNGLSPAAHASERALTGYRARLFRPPSV
jgi:hypothetical protein